MKYSTEKLKKRIEEKFGSQAEFSRAMGMEKSTISRLLERGDWRASQIEKAVKVLKIPTREIPSYFFEKSVVEIQRESEDA